MTEAEPQSRPQSPDNAPSPIEQVAQALGTLRYGAIQLTVHDGKLVQLDITERRRFPT